MEIINQLPKNKEVLDFVLNQMSPSCSPDKFEILEGIFDLYRTSTGFDPKLLSKVRFKRVKSSELKHIIQDIEKDILQIIHSPSYKQLLYQAPERKAQIEQYQQLSLAIATYPPESLESELHAFENELLNNDGASLLLDFMREHEVFYRQFYKTKGLQLLVSKFDMLAEHVQQKTKDTRLNFIIAQLIDQSKSGNIDYALLVNSFQETELLLLSGNRNLSKNASLLKIIQLGICFNTPNKYLSAYLPYIKENIHHFQYLDNTIQSLVYNTLAMYSVDEPQEQRLQWILNYDQLNRDYGMEAQRALGKLTSATIAIDNDDLERGIKLLNETEHLVYKSSWKQIDGRNVWLKVAKLRMMIFTYKHLIDSSSYADIDFDIVLSLIADCSIHRRDSSVIILEMNGLKNIARGNYMEAHEQLKKAITYRMSNPDHPMVAVCTLLNKILEQQSSKREIEKLIEEIRTMNEPIYSFFMLRYLKLVAKKLTKDKLKPIHQ